MKRYIVCIVVVLIACVAQVNAVNYKGTYKGGFPQSAYMAPATVPGVTFQSTSVYAEQWQEDSEQPDQPTLNADGTVNADAYGVGQRNTPAQRRIGNPIVNPNDPGNVPLGDGLWVLLLLAGAYVVVRRIKETRILGA